MLFSSRWHLGKSRRCGLRADRFRGLFPFVSIRNPYRRRSIDSEYALDARAVSGVSFQPWSRKPTIRTPCTCSCSSGSTARRIWPATTSCRSSRRCSSNRPWCAAGAGSAPRARPDRLSSLQALRADRARQMARAQAAPRLPTPHLIAGGPLFAGSPRSLTALLRPRRIRSVDGYAWRFAAESSGAALSLERLNPLPVFALLTPAPAICSTQARMGPSTTAWTIAARSKV
jgi:hypothetical protein